MTSPMDLSTGPLSTPIEASLGLTKADRQLYAYDKEEQTKWLEEKPWEQDPMYFRSVDITPLALMKMVPPTPTPMWFTNRSH